MAAAVVIAAVMIIAWVTVDNGLWWMVLAFVPIFLAVGSTIVMRVRPFRAGVIAWLLGFALVVGFASLSYLAAGPEDRSADPYCDGLCTSYWGGWALMWTIASIVATPIALVSGVLAAIFAAGNKSATVAG